MAETYVAKFQTSKQFYIVGIGLILTGEILDGKISYGNYIKFRIKDREVIYTITAVETIEYMTAGASETALILELTTGDTEINYLEEIVGQLVDIVD